MLPIQARSHIIQRLKEDLVGPLDPLEVIESQTAIKPSDVYLTGILWPKDDRITGEEDDGNNGNDEGEGSASPSPVGLQRPCTMGLSIATSSSREHRINISIRFATYVHEAPIGKDGKPQGERWTRKPWAIDLPDVLVPDNDVSTPDLAKAGLVKGLGVEIQVRGRRKGESRIATITLINRSVPAEKDRVLIEAATLFQASIEITPGKDTMLIPRPVRPMAADKEEEVNRLLYRNQPEFGAGHQCSVGWDFKENRASRVFSTWLPSGTVPAFREDGHDVFQALVEAGTFDAARLSALEDKELIASLRSLPAAYREWMLDVESRIPTLDAEFQAVAAENLKTCHQVHDRMAASIDVIEKDPLLRKAFRLANHAMSLQHSWKRTANPGPLKWRPFQLGFILLAAPSVSQQDHPDRGVLDLLWFPTGGGKTEAYLALIATLAFYRRLKSADPDDGSGNAAVMRYTLRLLTAQQFERASSLILACELIRRGTVKSKWLSGPVGTTPFSIGLWVGGDASPNNFAQALETRGRKDLATAEQLEECPCCHGELTWKYDQTHQAVSPRCPSTECILGAGFGEWPVHTVDSDVYRERPTLLIGTIDKFAQITTREDIRDLFQFRRSGSTDLIIQDELHLISGPLGTIAGVYEIAFDWLLGKGGTRPKVVGSTATIRRASEQILSLFDRSGCQFPPPGIDHDDSGFAVRDPKKPGREYIGITTAGRSAKFSLQAAAASLLQSAGESSIPVPMERDGYATLLAYFNSLRELGGAIVQMLDDVPDTIQLYTRRRPGQKPRPLTLPRELTSRASQKEILEILTELKRPTTDPDCVDVVLATNMVSVGVDVSRLGLMLLNGQPKTRSEYIQATSRVGRSGFPGLIVSVLNAAKARDRSHYETFPGWHGSLYREVEATSVTPFASRARDKALHAALVAMIRHEVSAMHSRPDLSAATDAEISSVLEEIERRVKNIDPREAEAVMEELRSRLDEWDMRAPRSYLNEDRIVFSLMQSAESFAQKVASGRRHGDAWPVMNNMRSVEPSTRFRMAESLSSDSGSRAASKSKDGPEDGPAPAAPARNRPWRKNG